MLGGVLDVWAYTTKWMVTQAGCLYSRLPSRQALRQTSPIRQRSRLRNQAGYPAWDLRQEYPAWIDVFR